MSTENITLEKSIQAYRVMNTPTHLSWKQHWANETFSNDDLLLCPEDERKQFEKRLVECGVSIADNIRIPSNVLINVCTLSDLVKTIIDPANKSLQKLQRKVIYSTSDGTRPQGEEAFLKWNGFQVIDLDIKNEEFAEKLKPLIFKRLYKCNWFLGVTKSSSGAGLHIYTKISIPESENDLKKKKLLFFTNFRHKFSFVYIVLCAEMQTLGYCKDDILKWMDAAMAKPQQGAFIGYDAHPYINTHFFEDFIYVNFDNVEDLGSPEIDWVTHPDLQNIFKRYEWFVSDNSDQIEVELLNKGECAPEFDTHNKVHYKHYERWRLANTLVNIFGKGDGFKYLRMICSNAVKDKELQADCETAARHNKGIDPWAVNRLNSVHGFKIKVNVDDKSFDETSLFNSMNTIHNPTMIVESKYVKNFHLKSNQYLSDIRYEILDSCGRVTLIEAGAGVGKTEMVKFLVKEGKKILMVEPFQSTIKSKVESDRDWSYSYGNKKPNLDAAKGLCVTIDKFSHMNLMDVKTYGFDYIFIDESHLMFQSDYRPVMTKVVDMIRNTEVPIILMSGTPSGEILFFPDIIHIKVVKDDNRKKEFRVRLLNKPSDQIYVMCKNMAKDIAEGKRILFPTNNGTLYFKQIKAAVTYFLQQDYAYFEEVNVQYYKKSNLGDEFMDVVNFEKTIKDIQILMCTTFLSVGVDILDRYKFQVYFADLMLPQEIEQFANRLRANDLYINMYIAKNDADGNTRSLHKFRPLNFELNEDEIKDVHSLLRICNDMIERNPIEYKYNSLVSSIISDNKFIEYHDIDNKYYLNEIAYKVNMFEQKYRDYAQQLPVVMKGMESYGYVIDSVDVGDFELEGSEVMSDLKTFVQTAYDEQLELNTKYIEELLDKITEDRLALYREVMAGKYDIKKGADWKEDLSNHRMIVKSIEVFEKVVPICTSLSKSFDCDDIGQIFEYCRNKNRTFNFAAINRIRILSNMLYNDQHQRLDLPIKEFMDETYKFVEPGSATQTEINDFISQFTRKYMIKASTNQIKIANSPLTVEMLIDKFTKIFKCLVKCTRPNKQRVVKMEKIELLWRWKTTNGENLNNSRVIDDFLGMMKDLNIENIETEECEVNNEENVDIF